MKYIDCKQYAQEILDLVKAVPRKKKLVIISVGDNHASKSYIKGKIKDCEYCGIPYDHIQIEENANTPMQLVRAIVSANIDDTVGGIILQLPLPTGMSEDYYTNMINPDKDVDGFIKHSRFDPCTPEAIMYLLHREVGELSGKAVTLVGRGKLVGKPLAKMLLDSDCTVTIAHSKTKNLLNHLQFADIVISAVGKPTTVNLDACWNADLVIDVGVNRDSNGKLCGDCWGGDVDELSPRVTPVPGGIGLLTRAMLMAHMTNFNLETLLAVLK